VIYRLRVTARAVADADEAHAWIAEHLSAARAERWYQGLFKQMETLTRQPSRCPRATSEKGTQLINGPHLNINLYQLIIYVHFSDYALS
jgi:plasmid stabilization system protein ParE